MARKNKEPEKKKVNTDGIMGLHGSTVEQAISETLEINYMPYAMSVIVSRAIPEIDGFKPSHRKLLYTMYKMGLLTGNRTKSANIVGQTMRLNPHGDQAIYETMVRLAKGNEENQPLVDKYIEMIDAIEKNLTALRESIGTPAAEAAPEPEAPADSVTIEFPIDAQPAAEEKKTCPQCGAPVSDDALFCNKCGAQL
mgnify:CR=1 FL=1